MVSKVGRVFVLFLVLLFVCAPSTPDVQLPEAPESQGDDTDELQQFVNDMDTTEEDGMDDNESMKKPEEYLEDGEGTDNARIVKRMGFFFPPIVPSTSTPARNSVSPTPRFTPSPRVFPSKSTPLRNAFTSASPTSRLVVASRSILLTFQSTNGRSFQPTSGRSFQPTSGRSFQPTRRRPFTGCPLDCGKLNVFRRRSHSKIMYVHSHRAYFCCKICCRLYSFCLYFSHFSYYSHFSYFSHFSYYSHPSVCYARALDCASRCRGFVQRYECRWRFRG